MLDRAADVDLTLLLSLSHTHIHTVNGCDCLATTGGNVGQVWTLS